MGISSMMIVAAFIVAVLSSIDSDLRDGVNAKWLRRVGLRFSINFPVALLAVWYNLPALVGPLWGLGWYLILLLAANFLAGLFLDGRAARRSNGVYFGHERSRSKTSSSYDFARSIKFSIYCFFAVIGVVTASGVHGSKLLSSSHYTEKLGPIEEVEWRGQMPIADGSHIRMIDDSIAWSKANKVLGPYGSSFHIDTNAIQKVQDRLEYVGDLGFNGFFQWKNNPVSPGYTIVDAEDNVKPAELVASKIRYSPTACFTYNLQRHLWNEGYSRKQLTDFTLEIDDERKPWWVVTVMSPSLKWWAPDIEGVVIVDPDSGAHKFYAQNTAPEWVDRIYPEKEVHDRIDWHGLLQKGYWASKGFGDSLGLYQVTHTELHMTWADGRPFWFAGVTSISEADSALTGVLMVDTRTGEPRMFKLPGSPQNEDMVHARALNLVRNFQGYQPAAMILYEVEGEPTWVGPVVSSGEFQELAMVHYERDVKAMGKDKLSALRAYKSSLFKVNDAAPGELAKIASYQGPVTLIGQDIRDGNAVYILYFAERPDHKFSGDSRVSLELPLTHPGDNVRVSFNELEEEEEARILSFDNLGILPNRN